MQINRPVSMESILLPRTEPTANPAEGAGGPSFTDVLRKAVTQVEQDQVRASDAAVRLASGQVQDIAEVMIASERANLTLGMALQVRNKVLEAYQEIMRTPL